MGCFYSSNKTKGLCCGLRKRKKRKQFLEALAVEAKSSELLSCIPGRMCVNGSSRIASIFTQQGRKGTNQDAMIVWENFASLTDATFCGVFDGHGPFGHLVARKVRDSLPAKLVSQFKEQLQGEYDTMDLQNPDILKAWKDSFLGAYNVMDTELKLHPTIDSFCSGTTAVTLLLQGKDLVLANVGDSRAILGRRNDNNNVLEAVQLTVDLKPNLPNEAERIKQFKGRVFALEDEPEVPRVWLPHDNSPGLAMARAFGDFCLKDFGLIAVPDISYHQIIDADQFIVLATDGIWDVLSNKEVVDVVASAPTRTTAARAVVETAVRAWRLKYPSSKIDDCAVVCLFLSQQQPLLKTVEHKIKASSEVFYTAEDGRNNNNPTDPKTVTGFVPPSTTLEDSSLQEMESDDSSSGGDQELEQGEEDRNSPLLVEENCDIIKEEKVIEQSHSRRSLAECLSAADDNEWSALEGVTRVNSLLNLPRFLVGDKRIGRAGSSARFKKR